MAQTVLLVDDDIAMRQSTEQALELAGHTVCTFASAEEALEYGFIDHIQKYAASVTGVGTN